MAANISNRTFNSSYEKMMSRYLSASESACISWLVVLITECLAIVILNLITIVVFVKKRQLQRRSTYLIIHLVIVDLLVGAVSGPLQIDRGLAANHCNLWQFSSNLIWSSYLKTILRHLFSFTSLLNLVAISLERLHATFRSFRHRFIKKWVYIVIIIVIWLTTTAREAAQILLLEVTGGNSALVDKSLYLSFYFIFLFVICVSYSLIVIKVRCSRHPQFHGVATKRERKLTGTSLIVTLVSFLCLLPALTIIMLYYVANRLSTIHSYMISLIAFLANSLINPVIYALRMPGFRAGVSQIFCRAPNRIITPADLPLRNFRN